MRSSDGDVVRGSRVVMLLLNDFAADTRVMKEASSLTAHGWEVTVLCLRGEGLPEDERRGGVRVRRVAESTRSAGRDLLGKLAEMRTRSHALVKAALAESPDVVHCHDTDTLKIGAKVSMSTGARLVYDAHELFLDQIRGHGRSRLAQEYWARVERRWIPRCDLRIAANEARAHLLGERYHVPFESIQNLPDLEPLLRTDRLHRELMIHDRAPLILYQGVLIAGRSLERLVRAAARLPEAHLVIQGSGPLEGQVRAAVLDADAADRVHLMGHIPPEELHSYACSADIGVVIYENTSLNNYYAAPNKLWAYMMAGIPVASSDFPGLRDVVAGEAVGTLFDPADEDSVLAALRELLGDASRRRRAGERARRLAEERYNWGVESGRFIELYRSLSEVAR